MREGVHAVFTTEGGAVLDERTGHWTHLCPTAATAAAFLLDETTRAGAITRYATRLRVTVEVATRTVDTVAATLRERDLITDRPPRVRRHRRWGCGW